MKTTFLVLSVVLSSFCGSAQSQDPVTWTFTAKKVNAGLYQLHLTAKPDEGWHIYSQSTPDGGPVATTIAFDKNSSWLRSGPVKESGKLEEHFEELFGVNVKKYSGKVSFVQTVTVKKGVKTAVTGAVEYMACNDTECMPPQKTILLHSITIGQSTFMKTIRG